MTEQLKPTYRDLVVSYSELLCGWCIYVQFTSSDYARISDPFPDHESAMEAMEAIEAEDGENSAPRISMNHAERVKELAQKFAEAHSHCCSAYDGEHEECSLKWRREVEAALHAAIAEMQAELDRLREWQEKAFRAFGAIEMHIEVVRAEPQARGDKT